MFFLTILLFYNLGFHIVFLVLNGFLGGLEIVLDEGEAGQGGEAGAADADEGNAEENAEGGSRDFGHEDAPHAEAHHKEPQQQHEPPALGTGAVVFDGVEGEINAFEEDECTQKDGDDFGVDDDEHAENEQQYRSGDAHGFEAACGRLVFEDEEDCAGDDDDNAYHFGKELHGGQGGTEAEDAQGGEEDAADDETKFATLEHGLEF